MSDDMVIYDVKYEWLDDTVHKVPDILRHGTMRSFRDDEAGAHRFCAMMQRKYDRRARIYVEQREPHHKYQARRQAQHEQRADTVRA